MDLRTERKIKFWLATISKVLVIALVLFKLIDIMFDKDDTITTDSPHSNNLVSDIVLDSLPKSALNKKEQKQFKPETKTTVKQKNNSNTLINTNTKKTETKYVELALVNNSFMWLKSEQKFRLKLKNTGNIIANSIKVNAVLFYEREQQTVIINHSDTINISGTLDLEFTTSDILNTSLPKTILLCITHNNTTAKNNWYNYILGNKVAGNGAIETRSLYYDTISTSSGLYAKTPPNCELKVEVPKAEKISKNSNINIDKIKSSTQLFLRGLNNKSKITTKSTTTSRLYSKLTEIGANTYSYGFSYNVEVISQNTNTAIVKLVLSGNGRDNFIKQQAVYRTKNNPKQVSDFFKFLQKKDSYWEGKLVNTNGIWKFDVY